MLGSGLSNLIRQSGSGLIIEGKLAHLWMYGVKSLIKVKLVHVHVFLSAQCTQCRDMEHIKEVILFMHNTKPLTKEYGRLTDLITTT